jgi:hypothetical protein
MVSKFLGQSMGDLLTVLCRVLESLKNRKRLPEAQFQNLKVAAKRQQSVYGMFKTPNSASRPDLRPNELSETRIGEFSPHDLA